MARLIYSALTSLDGCIEDAAGNFDWATPDEEVHAFVNDLQRPIGTYLLGRRMYEVMVYWETVEPSPDEPGYLIESDFAELWRAADKVVYSRSLKSVSSDRTRIEREFDADSVRLLKSESKRDVSIAGPELAAAAITAGLVDEFQQFVSPVVVGGGKRWLPEGVRLPLTLLDERRFGNGVVYLRYRTSD